MVNMLLSLLTTALAVSTVSAKTTKVASATTTQKAAKTSASAAGPTIKLDYSTLVPVAGNSSIGYYKYQNIRFAAAPTGSRRFAAPTWPSKETGVNAGGLASQSVDCSSTEDCLFLDVWVPAKALTSKQKLPVAVWTYGGGFTGGSKSQNTPEGLFNITKDFIFVAYNYRLGITGLANGPTFAHEGGSTNTAIRDVEHAFKWVRKYISNFGGDSKQVTAVGFSAGASQTLFQLTRYSGRNEQLFERAYVMSPGFVPGAGHQHAEQFWQNVSSAVGCDGGHLSCMRTVNFTTLTTAASTVQTKYNYQFQPRVDGDIIADTYEAQFYQNRFKWDDPLVITHEQHEANSQSYSGVNTTDDVAKYLKIFFPAIEDTIVQQALSLYPESSYSSPGLRFADMKQNFDLTAHNLAVTHALNNKTWNAIVALGSATHGTDQSYYWYSTYSLQSSQSSGSSSSGAPSGAGGGSGGPPSGSTGGNSTSTGGMSGGMGGSGSVDSATAIKMQKYLLSFILTGNPNTKWANDKLNWPMYNSQATGIQLVFITTFTTAADDLANERCLFWNKALWY
ncbi:Carboxylesterase-like protein 4 [Elsinoe fawcettii]|nr:Carboxylesterase-like protein 4 [Elsinoe fawcettii]